MMVHGPWMGECIKDGTLDIEEEQSVLESFFIRKKNEKVLLNIIQRKSIHLIPSNLFERTVLELYLMNNQSCKQNMD